MDLSNLPPIPRYPFNSDEVDKALRDGTPVIITGSRMCDSSQKWDLGYLERHSAGSDIPFNVVVRMPCNNSNTNLQCNCLALVIFPCTPAG